MGLLLGFRLVEAIIASQRLRNVWAWSELGWTPCDSSLAEGLKSVPREMDVKQ